MRNLLFTQLLIIVAVAIYFTIANPSAVIAVIYGGGIAVVNNLLLACRVKRIQKRNQLNPQQDVMSLYLGAVERFVFTLGAMMIAMGGLSLSPIPLLITFSLTQFAYILTPALHNKVTVNGE